MKFLMPFFDDTTLMFSSKTATALRQRGHVVDIVAVDTHEMSERQINAHSVSDHPTTTWAATDFNESYLAGYDAVITCKAPLVINRMLGDQVYRSRRDRPAFVAFQPGLEFTPERGRKNRRNFDIVFLYSAKHRNSFKAKIRPNDWQHVSFGHPYFTTPAQVALSGRNIYFYAQAISPLTAVSRRFLLDILVTLARRHTDRDVYIKLRHLPGENATHVHKEVYSYPSLLERYFPDAPANLKLTACTMAESLKDAAIAITCTSTAVMDAVSAGVPSMIYLDYVENYRDKYSGLMRDEFSDSGLVSDIHQIMRLEPNRPDTEWMDQHFRGDDLYAEMIASVTAFKTRSKLDCDYV
jgi:hypothetical protein